MNGIAIRIFIPLLLYLIQQYFLAPLLGGFVHPELLLCWLLSWTFLSGSREGIRMGIYCGFLMDFSSTTFFVFLSPNNVIASTVAFSKSLNVIMFPKVFVASYILFVREKGCRF